VLSAVVVLVAINLFGFLSVDCVHSVAVVAHETDFQTSEHFGRQCPQHFVDY